MVGFFYEKYLGFLPTLINSETCYPHLIKGGITGIAPNPPYKLGVLDHFLINSYGYVKSSKIKIQALIGCGRSMLRALALATSSPHK